MAINTENRRRSTLGVLPVPDGTIGQADRQQVLEIYAGILATAPVAVVGMKRKPPRIDVRIWEQLRREDEEIIVLM